MKKLFGIFSLLICFSLVACMTPEDEETTETETTNPGPGGSNSQKEPLRFNNDFTYLFAEDDWYRENEELYTDSNFSQLEEQLVHRTGIVVISNEDMYDKESKANYTFIGFNPDYSKFSLREHNEDEYIVYVESSRPMEIIQFENNQPSQIKVTSKRNEQDFVNGYYVHELYTMPKNSLTSNDEMGRVLYNIDHEQIKITNYLKDINFRDVFVWEEGDSLTLNEFLNTYKKKEGDRSENPLLIDVFAYTNEDESGQPGELKNQELHQTTH